MATLRVDHPDIVKFITCKSVEGVLPNFNISVGITDKFMEAYKTHMGFDLDKERRAHASYDLVNPRTGCLVGKANSVEIMDMIVENAWKNGEPGLLFIDRMNQTNPLPHLYTIETTNPCGV
jgi:ribonucleoside-diphosphate reductase alpha chain